MAKKPTPKSKSKSKPRTQVVTRRPRANGAPAADDGVLADLRGQLTAIDKSQAVIQFDLNGNILVANDNFLHMVGYRLEELQGQNHSLLVDAHYRSSEEYRHFWDNLRRGECQIGQYKRIAKGGREAWLYASYNPVFDATGKPCKVLKLASDVTAQVNGTQQMQTAVAQTQDVIKAAIGGDLSGRVDTAGVSGDVLKMAEAINLLLEGTPAGIDPEAVTKAIAALEGVDGVHHLHIWALGPSRPALSCHLMVGDIPVRSTGNLLARVNELLERDYGIAHTTVQFEFATCDVDDPYCVPYGDVK